MNYFDFLVKNQKAIESTRLHPCKPLEVDGLNQRLKYRGFVNCVAADNENSFIMFNNADDVVAAHYMYAGPSSFETETLRIWIHLAKKSKWIYDIGAFTGVFSLAAVAANPYCYVMAFEPSFVTYSRLLVNIHSNEFDARISPVRFGVGAEVGELELRHPSGVYVMASDESFLDTRISDPWYTEKVQIVSLDHFLANQDMYRKEIIVAADFSRVDLLKIDVEGFETEVLKGMKEIIENNRPTAIVEILNRDNIGEILSLFGDGYTAHHAGDLLDTPEGANVLFIHEDNIGMLSDYS